MSTSDFFPVGALMQRVQPTTRRGTARIVGAFCRSTRTDLEDEIPSILSTLIGMLTDPDEGTVKVRGGAYMRRRRGCTGPGQGSGLAGDKHQLQRVL